MDVDEAKTTYLMSYVMFVRSLDITLMIVGRAQIIPIMEVKKRTLSIKKKLTMDSYYL